MMWARSRGRIRGVSSRDVVPAPAAPSWLAADGGVVVISFPPSYSFEELDAQFTEMERWFLARITTRHVVVVDLFAVTSSNARNRARIADARGEAATKNPFLAQGYVIRSVALRSALTAVHWVRKPPWPVRVFAARADALDWAHTMVAEKP